MVTRVINSIICEKIVQVKRKKMLVKTNSKIPKRKRVPTRRKVKLKRRAVTQKATKPAVIPEGAN